MPGAAPARVLKFLKRHPVARPTEITMALGLKRSTVEMAITRLVQMKLYVRPAHSPCEARQKKSSPSPTASLRIARENFGVAATVGPSLRAMSPPDVHPTGATLDHSGGVQMFGISGPQLTTASEYAHRATPSAPGSAHPWGYLTNFGKPR